MLDFNPRKIKFKAWNVSTHLLMRLNTFDCNKGELVKKEHVLLQFTGLCDREGEEIYDQDILLIYSEKYLVFWNDEKNGWCYRPLDKPQHSDPFVTAVAATMKRFCSYFELN